MSPVGKLIYVLFFSSVNVTFLPVTKQLSPTVSTSSSQTRCLCMNHSQPKDGSYRDSSQDFLISESDLRLDDPNYFEGDLNVTQNDINAYYKRIGRTRLKRAVRRDKDKLRPEGIVYYKFHNSIDPVTENTIV